MIRFLFHILRTIKRWEWWILSSFLLLFLLSGGILLWQFHRENTVLVPTTGGTYIEGSVGELQPLIPWFTIQNDVNRDIVSLVFAGLLKYNPQTKRVEDDLATLKISESGKVYTLRLKDDLFWHDSSDDNPHPVTADDVLFTFKTIQDPQFGNSLLRQNFQGIKIEKLDEKTVQFRLEEAYDFFPSNLTLGLLPQQSFEGIPVGKFEQVLDFGFQPVGAGPYRVKSVVQTELSTEVTLERFLRALPPPYRLDRIILRIFPDYPTLLSDLRNLDGVRLVPRNDRGEPIIPKRFVGRNYTLPQYVALFFNLDRSALQDQKLRLGLQLGTDKQEIVDVIHETAIVDTPLLEIENSDWRYKFDPESAQGALFESKWYLPEKVRLQHLLEQQETNAVGPLKIAPVVLLDTGSVLTITGSLADVSPEAKVNGLPLIQHPTSSGTWVVGLPTHGGTGSIVLGDNLIRLTGKNGAVLDSFYLWRTANVREYRLALGEQNIVERFRLSRTNALPEKERISVKDLFLEKGNLRLRQPSDPVDIRVNDAGKRLSLTLLTSPTPPQYAQVADVIKDQWGKLGVRIEISIPDTRDEFQNRLLKRDYDVLLFGQSLLDNLDSYPYWHSSGVQKLTGNLNDVRLDAYNLSQYASFKADALLETVRETDDEKERTQALQELGDVLKSDVPAVFLYSPLYTFAHREDILGIELQNLSLHSDRFLTLQRWYMKLERVFRPETGWFSVFGWILGLWGAI